MLNHLVLSANKTFMKLSNTFPGKKITYISKQFMLWVIFMLNTIYAFSQTGTWSPLANSAPAYSGGVMLLLTDGTVLVKGYAGAGDCDNSWYKLMPDAQGSYINGVWSVAAAMNDSRLYCSSRILRNGKVYVAGGEYGTGKASTEIYNPVTDSWDYSNGVINPGDSISDANSEILPDGKILQAIVSSETFGLNGILIYDPKTDSYTYGPPSISYHDESSWLKLADNSILFVDLVSYNSERYIPALNTWIPDGNIPVMLYDFFGFEAGASLLLPDGRGFFIGSTSTTALYTPSGTTANGTWVAGPPIPNNLGAPDAAAAMMPNGHILCAFSPTPSASDVDSIFKSPTYFYEYNYVTNAFTQVSAPDGTPSLNIGSYLTNMLVLPDGNILYGTIGDDQFYVYTPGGTPLAIGKPTINTVSKQNCDTLMLTGTLFNGISEGAAYGDDWQMATNYPIAKFTDGINVYYGKTYNWNSDGVQRGVAADTVYCAIPSGMTPGSYSLTIVANGISSDPVNFLSCTVNLADHKKSSDQINIYPNPGAEKVYIEFIADETKPYTINVTDILGNEVLNEKGNAGKGKNKHTLNISSLEMGIYQVKISHGSTSYSAKLIVNQ